MTSGGRGIVMPTQVGIHVFPCRISKDVDGGPPPAMTITHPRFAFGITFAVMAGLVPAIGRGTLPLRMAGTSPAMTATAGIIQGGSADGRCERAMTAACLLHRDRPE